MGIFENFKVEYVFIDILSVYKKITRRVFTSHKVFNDCALNVCL